MTIDRDFLVIGSGIAGLTFALKAAEFGSVAIVTKDNLYESATRYAQGGIASVMAEDDSYDFHVKDTLEAGRGLCIENVVKHIVRDGPARVRELIQLGTQFARTGSLDFDLGHEGGHSKRRILHANDLTGLEVERALIEAVRDQSNIETFTYHMAIDLVTLARLNPRIEPGSDEDEALGLYSLDIHENRVKTFLGKVTMLATGGAGKVYLYTSNPDTATGDGIAMAYRIGAKIANMEFFQFHPTCLYHPEAKSFLVSETVRGEGGVLRRKNGDTFMERHDERGCLAPRDVVARAIDYEMKVSGENCVYLDVTHIEPYRIRERFPNIYKACLSFGFDMTREPVPVVPAAHYMCGGVMVDLNGQTSVKRLFASGETCYSGLHGSNRLASNSLLEGLVLSHRAVSKAVELMRTPGRLSAIAESIPNWDNGDAVPSDERVVVSQNWDEIRRLMWNYVGIVRSNKRLLRAQRRINLLIEEIQEYYWNFHINKDIIELRNIAVTARLVILGALQRKESRGLHYNIDYPETDNLNWKRETILRNPARSLITRFPSPSTLHDL